MLAKLCLEDPPLDDKNTRVCSKHFLPEDFTGGVLEGFGPLKKTLKPDAVPLVFCYVPPPKQRKSSEAQITLATHRDMVNELLSAGPSNHQNELESEPHTKDVGIQCGKYFTVCVHALVYL